MDPDKRPDWIATPSVVTKAIKGLKIKTALRIFIWNLILINRRIYNYIGDAVVFYHDNIDLTPDMQVSDDVFTIYITIVVFGI